MTRNQIEFQKLKEDIRHNKQTESVASLSQLETARHNYADEGIQRSGVQETARHNVQTENINWYTAQNTGKLQSSQSQYYRESANTQITQQSKNRADEELALEKALSETPARLLTMATQKLRLAELRTERERLEKTANEAIETEQRARLAAANAQESVARANKALAEAGYIPKDYHLREEQQKLKEQETLQGWFKVGTDIGNAFVKGIGTILPLIAE
jgi:hypothetical protein